MSQSVALTVLAVSAAALALAAAASFFVLLSVARRLARLQDELERLLAQGGEAVAAARRAAAGFGQEVTATGQALRGFLAAGAMAALVAWLGRGAAGDAARSGRPGRHERDLAEEAASLATRYLVRRWRRRRP